LTQKTAQEQTNLCLVTPRNCSISKASRAFRARNPEQQGENLLRR
jgi:hypothetical protein